ncbi:MAG: GH25 family lysozyme [Mycobacteriales bacterium]
MTLHALTANIRVDLPDRDAETEIRRDLAFGPDVLLLQEVGGRAAVFDRIAGEGVYGEVRFGRQSGIGGGAARNNVILYRRARLGLTDRESTLLHRSILFRSATRYLTSALFLDQQTGRPVPVNNVHMVPHADTSAGWLTSYPRRRLVIAALDVITAKIAVQKASGALVITGGDWNNNDKADAGQDKANVQARLGAVGARSNFDVLGTAAYTGTHGRDFYDSIYVTGPAAFARETVHPRGLSDHHAVSVWLEVAPIKPAPVPAASVPVVTPAPTPTAAPKEPLMAARIDGIDLSHWQSGALDFNAAKRAGVRFVSHKASEGTDYRDAKYGQRRRECAAAGVPFGAYHFARPSRSGGTAQAKFFLSVADPKPGDLRPMLDLEDRGGLSIGPLSGWVGDFVAEVVRQIGVPPFIYTSFDLDDTFDCPLWVARYSNAMSAPHIPAPWKRYTIWQFSDGVYGHPSTVPGIGKCDINTLNTSDPAALVKAFILTAPAAPEPAVVEPKPALTPTQEPTVPNNRITQARGHLATALKLLDDAQSIEHRTGWVRIATGVIRTGYNRLPRS